MSRTHNTDPRHVQCARYLRKKGHRWRVWYPPFNKDHGFGPYGIAIGGVNKGIKEVRKEQTRKDRAATRDALKQGREPDMPRTNNAEWELH